MVSSKRRKGAVASVVGTALLVGSVLVAPGASAANASWDGDGGNADWSTAANWSAAPPGSGETATFPDGPANKTVNVDAGAGANLNFTGSGYELELVALTAFGDVTATGAGTNTVDLHAEMSGSLVTVGAGSTLVFGERIELEDAAMTIDGAGRVQMPGGVTALIRDNDVIKDGSGVLDLNGDNFSWSGDLDVNAGTVNATTSLPGASAVSVDGGTLNVSQVINGPITQTGGLVHLLGPSATVTGPTSISGGTFLLDDGTAAPGGITQTDGVLRCDGSLALIGGTGYSGTIDARFDLGAATDDVGGCTVVGPFSLTGPDFNNAGVMEFDLAGGVPTVDYDQLEVIGTVDVTDALLTLDLNGPVAPGEVLTLIDNDGVDPIVGDFGGNPEGIRILFAGPDQTFVLSYVGGTGNDLTLTALPQLSVADTAVAESGGPATVTFSLDAAAATDVTFDVATADVTATTAGDDYVETDPTGVTIPAGELAVDVTVPVLDDDLDEANETFTVTATNLTGDATTADGQATVTILDDDGSPTIAIDDVTIVEGDAGTSGATFTITLSEISGQLVNGLVDAVAVTATDPDDVAGFTNQPFAIPPGELTTTVVVEVAGDEVDEVDETFDVTLHGIAPGTTDAVGSDLEAVGTIDDDDGPTISITDEDALESVDAEFFVTLSAPSPQDVSVDFAVVPGTATAADLVLDSGTITIPAGEVEALLVVDLLQDALDEADETYTVVLGTAVDGVVAAADDVQVAAGATGTGVITDDDPTPTLSIADASVTEGTGGTRSVTLTATLSAVSGQDVSATLSTATGTAGAADFGAVSTTVSIPAGSTSGTVTVPIATDAVDESDETFTATLSNPVGVVLADASATVTIVDDDAAVRGGGLARTGVAGLGLLLVGAGLLLTGGGTHALAGRRRRS